ncbi:hypothetical protein [Faecalibacterium prausnitzii]|uniref:hypothetical protein n=1 Tax=Faecalibacterium prausnitzii TaxID=853 RepID=UPI001CC063B2|nr:hypothetical protein [Faecalibacterium prausnitzii]
MKTLFRVLGAAAAVAATGAAIVVLDKVLNDKGPLHVEEVEFPEEAEKDPAEAAKAAEAYAEGEARTAEPGDAWPPAFEKASEEKASEEKASEEPEAPAAQPETAEEKSVAEEAPVNPVEAGPAVAPKDETGKFDVTKIAEASDFTGVEEESGCKS